MADDDWSAPVHADDWSDPVHHGTPASAPLDDTEHAASPLTIARASLATDPKVQMQRYAEAFGQPIRDFNTIGDHIVRLIPGTDQYARVEPSVRGATGLVDAAKRAFDWVAGGAGPAIPAVASGGAMVGAALLAPETGGASLLGASAAGGVGASAGEIARQKLDAALAPKGQEAPLDLGNVAWQGAAGLAGPTFAKGIGAAARGIAPVLENAGRFLGEAEAGAGGLPDGAASIQDALRDGTVPIAPKGSAADALAQRIKNVAQSFYKKAADAGVVISPESFGKFADDLPGELTGYHPVVNEQAARIVKMLQGEADNGPMTLDKLDSLRSVASGISAGRDLNEARIAGNIVGKIDDYIDNLKPTDLVGEPGADVDAAAGALNNARGMWRTYSKLKTINDIVDTGEMLNDQNWVKGRFRALVKSSQFDRFTPDEQDAIASVARTGNLEKAIKLLPWRGLQMASTYAEPLMQDAKIGAVQDVIAKGAPVDVQPVAAAAGSASDDSLIAKVLTQAGIVEGEGQAGQEVDPRRSVEITDVPGLRK